MIRTRLETKGVSEYLERVAAAGRDIDEVTDRMLMAGGEVLLKGMRRRAPVLTHNLQGKLTIVGPVREGNTHYIWVGIPPNVDKDTARYALAQEFGWGDKQGAKAGQPYVRPTLDADSGAARKAMRNEAERSGLV